MPLLDGMPGGPFAEAPDIWTTYRRHHRARTGEMETSFCRKPPQSNEEALFPHAFQETPHGRDSRRSGHRTRPDRSGPGGQASQQSARRHPAHSRDVGRSDATGVHLFACAGAGNGECNCMAGSQHRRGDRRTEAIRGTCQRRRRSASRPGAGRIRCRPGRRGFCRGASRGRSG